MSGPIYSFNNGCGCNACHCPNRAWVCYGMAMSPSTHFLAESAASMSAAIEAYDFTGLAPGQRVERAYGSYSVHTPGSGPLKIYHHEFYSYKWSGSPSSVVTNKTLQKFAAGWFQPANDYYWKTVITRTGELRNTGQTHAYGIFAPPVQTKVHCTPNEVIVFGLPPLGETWIISDCADDYNYQKVNRDQELCLRACIGDAHPWWTRICTEFQTTSEEVTAYIAEYGACEIPEKFKIRTCLEEPRGDHNSVWACP